MPRYLLQQWTKETVRVEDRDEHSNGTTLWAAPSSFARLMELSRGDVVIIASLREGLLLPICSLTVARTLTREQLIEQGEAGPYDLPYFAVSKRPRSRMNLRHTMSRQASGSIKKSNGQPLARRKKQPSWIDGQAFRTPQWLEPASAQRLIAFIDDVLDREDEAGLDDPRRITSGMAPRLTAAERRAVELRAMEVVTDLYRAEGYAVDDVSASEPWDLTARRGRQEWHVEVKGTTGDGRAVLITAGELRHARHVSRPALAIVSAIELVRGRLPGARGGNLSVHLRPWDTYKGLLTPTVYRYEPHG